MPSLPQCLVEALAPSPYTSTLLCFTTKHFVGPLDNVCWGLLSLDDVSVVLSIRPVDLSLDELAPTSVVVSCYTRGYETY
jgi:hypothetical protein